MKLLAIETSEIACSAALWADGDGVEIFDLVPRRHSELLLPMIDQLLNETSVSRNEIDAIAFSRGPGSFTGVRIATGVAQGLGFALDCPLLPVSTLAAIAQGCYRRSGAERVAAALDARMQEVYWGAYQLDTDSGIMRLQGDERCCGPDAVSLESSGWIGCGSGWETYGEILQQACGDKLESVEQESHCHALDIAAIAAVMVEIGEGAVTAEQARPVYLRNQVASRPR